MQGNTGNQAEWRAEDQILLKAAMSML